MDEKRETGTAPERDLADELRQLGERLGAVAKAAWESDTSRHIQQQLSEGLDSMTRELDEASKRIMAKDETQRLKTHVREVVDSPKTKEVTREIQDTLLTGLKELNTQLDRALERLRRDTPGPTDTKQG
jgi:hypothetical protein